MSWEEWVFANKKELEYVAGYEKQFVRYIFGIGNKTSQNRIWVNNDGTITINPGCEGQLCVSTKGPEHAKYYLSEKRPGGKVVVF